MRLRGSLLLLLLYGVLPLAQAWVYVALQPFADGFDTANFTASIVAYHWLLANVILGLKLPVFQNDLPYDVRIRLHIWSTLGLIGFLAWHAVYTIFLKVKLIDAVSWSLLGLFGGLLLLSILWIPIPGLKALRRKLVSLLRFGFLKSYDALKAGHKILFLVLAALTYVHIVQAQILALVPSVSALGYQLLFLSAAALFVGTRIHNLTLPTLEVRSVVDEGGIVRLALSSHPRLRYRAGQFAFLRFPLPELAGEEHPFSFTTARHEQGVWFAVRALGDFTKKLSQLKPGDRVRVNGGFGAFYPTSGHEPLALIGSGIGAAPLVSILKEIGAREPDREVVCLLSVNRREELVEAEALRRLSDSMPNLKLRTFAFEEDGRFYGAELFRQELGDAGRYRYFLCSSDRVRSIVLDALKSLGVVRRKIHFEAFNLG